MARLPGTAGPHRVKWGELGAALGEEQGEARGRSVHWGAVRLEEE